jgi:superfamily II DNA/RNA helicase
MSSSNTNMFKPSMARDVPEDRRNRPPLSRDSNMEDIEGSNDIQVIEKWDEMALPESVLRGIFAYGYEEPSPIQKRAICPILSGRDLIAQAQSGTGKTATFSIGSMSRINLESKTTQVLCLAPTRELTMQIATVYRGISQFLDVINVTTLVGGESVDDNVRSLKRDVPHVVIGTPGRVYDMIRRRALVTKSVRTFLLDEADEMLSHGFKEQVQDIYSYLPEGVQTCIFSATIPRYVFDITKKFMTEPLQIIVKAEQLTLEGISQHYIAVRSDVEKYEVLVDLYSAISVGHCIIYANSVARVQDLHQAMLADEYPVCSIHSNMSKQERELSLSEFRSGKCRVLISSNVTARGIDVQQVSCVINFDVPRDVSTYLHRIGRSGRWGRKGMGINLITERDVEKMREIEQYYSTQITELPADLSNI